MKKREIQFNLHDLNFILTFSGFAFFTSVTETIPSVVYRAFALLIALLCIIINIRQRLNLPKVTIVLLCLVLLLDIKSTLHLFLETPPALIGSRNFSLLFIYGVTLIPTYAFLVGYREIHWKSTLFLIELILFFTITKGYFSSLEITDEMRISLNSRQSTLAFGDNSSYLLILSLCLLKFSSEVKHSFMKWLWRCFLIGAIIMAVLGLARAGSRGPFVSALVGLIFFFFSLKIRGQLGSVLATLFLIITLGITPYTVEQFAPVLYSRVNKTVKEGDLSGRDVLFREAIQKIEEKPIIGSNPIILEPDSFTSCHNGYLVVGVGLGVLGLILYVCIVIWVLLTLFRRRSSLIKTELLFIASMAFVSSTRAMSGSDIMTTANYAMCMFAATVLASDSSHLTKTKQLFIH